MIHYHTTPPHLDQMLESPSRSRSSAQSCCSASSSPQSDGEQSIHRIFDEKTRATRSRKSIENMSLSPTQLSSFEHSSSGLSLNSSFDSECDEEQGNKEDRHQGARKTNKCFFLGYFRAVCLTVVLWVGLTQLLLVNSLFDIFTTHKCFYEDYSTAASPFEKFSGGTIDSSCNQRSLSSSINQIDYDAFWRDVLETATAAAGGSQDELPSQNDTEAVTVEVQSCPKVYVYNLSSAFKDTDSNRTSSRSFAFGRETIDGWHGRLRDTNQHHIGVIFEHRLSQPDNCYSTNDPSEADLFFIPLLLQRKKASEWASICQTLNITDLLAELEFLTPNTSHKHFFVFPKGHYSGEFCKGWFYDPHPSLNNSMRLAYSHVPGKAEDPNLVYFNRASENPEKDSMRHPNLVSIPYPSSLHWPGLRNNQTNYTQEYNNTSQDFDDHGLNETTGTNHTVESAQIKMPSSNHDPEQRQYLMSFVGRFDHGDVPVRSMIQRQCENYNDPSMCHIPINEVERRSSLPSQDILVKGSSIFCLEPAGDSPWRKSLSDSITFGCIPVLFSYLSDDVAPWHWGSWKDQGRVLIDRDAFLAGKIDLYALLSSIPDQLQTLLQNTISRHARQYQYSLRDDPMDAFHLTMTKMKEQAEAFEALI